MTHMFGVAGMKGVTELANLQNRRWVLVIGGYSAVTIPAVAFAVRAWAGPYPLAELAAVVLTFGNCFNLVTGVATSYCRAIGRPGLEARYSLVLVVGNMALSWPCTYLWGLPGAVGSTAAVQLLACAYFYRVMQTRLPAFDTALSSIHLMRVIALAVLAFGLELGSLFCRAPSVLAFASAAVAAAAALGVAGIWALRDTRSPLSRREALNHDAQN
jgi:O-antigen/teichoic acid export membrane protein